MNNSKLSASVFLAAALAANAALSSAWAQTAMVSHSPALASNDRAIPEVSVLPTVYSASSVKLVGSSSNRAPFTETLGLVPKPNGLICKSTAPSTVPWSAADPALSGSGATSVSDAAPTASEPKLAVAAAKPTASVVQPDASAVAAPAVADLRIGHALSGS